MREEAFYEYRHIIQYSLDLTGFDERISILNGLHPTYIYIMSRYRKDCVIDVDQQLLTVLLPIKPIILPSHIPYYSVVGRANLAQPSDIEMLGTMLVDVLTGLR